MAWSELNRNSKVKLEWNGKGFFNIICKSTNINTSIENAVEELYFNFEGKKFITLEINRYIIILDRFDNPDSDMFDIMGRRYKSSSSIFLTKAVTLGKVKSEQWSDYQLFSLQMTTLVKSWIELVKKDKEINADFLW